jgi:hypothetical protein
MLFWLIIHVPDFLFNMESRASEIFLVELDERWNVRRSFSLFYLYTGYSMWLFSFFLKQKSNSYHLLQSEIIMAARQTTDESNHVQARINCDRYDLPGLGPVTRGMAERARASVASVTAVATVPVHVSRSSVILDVEQQREDGKTKVLAKSANEKPLNFSLSIAPIDGVVEPAAALTVNANAHHQTQRKTLIQVDVDRCHSVELVYQQKN